MLGCLHAAAAGSRQPIYIPSDCLHTTIVPRTLERDASPPPPRPPPPPLVGNDSNRRAKDMPKVSAAIIKKTLIISNSPITISMSDHISYQLNPLGQ